MQPDLTPLAEGRLPIMVVSHERSGTHFLMNTLAECFDYVSSPWLDLDRHQFNINYYSTQNLTNLILGITKLKAANTIKSHHEFAFFSEIISRLRDSLEIVYIYRNPADVMASFWRFVQTWSWAEAPKEETALGFALAAPMGQSMRYQFRQYDTMLDRWANHVRHWRHAAAQAPNVHVVKYEALAERYDDTVRQLAAMLRVEPARIVPPDRHSNVVQRGDVAFEPQAGADNRQAVTLAAMSRFPELMKELGYDPGAGSE